LNPGSGRDFLVGSSITRDFLGSRLFHRVKEFGGFLTSPQMWSLTKPYRLPLCSDFADGSKLPPHFFFSILDLSPLSLLVMRTFQEEMRRSNWLFLRLGVPLQINNLPFSSFLSIFCPEVPSYRLTSFKFAKYSLLAGDLL